MLDAHFPQRQQLIKHGAEFVAGELLFLEKFAEDITGLEGGLEARCMGVLMHQRLRV